MFHIFSDDGVIVKNTELELKWNLQRKETGLALFVQRNFRNMHDKGQR